jgi:hypothetical protein
MSDRISSIMRWGFFTVAAEIGLRIALAFWRFPLMMVLRHSAKFNPNFLIQKAR